MGWLALILLLGGLLGLAILLCACKVSGDCSRMEEQNGGSMFVKDESKRYVEGEYKDFINR